MIEKFKKMDNSKKVPIVILLAVILIVFIIVFTFSKNNGIDYGKLKESSDKDLVYTADTITIDDTFYINIPHVNITGASIKSINENIKSYINDFAENEMVLGSYEYNINGKVLSLVLEIVDYGTSDTPHAYFKTYNINLESKTLVSDSELLSVYNVTSNDVKKNIEKQFKYWYENLIKEGYIEEEECDYECFLEYREVEDYMGDVSLYIDEGKLVAIKPFTVYSIFGEESYFKESDFKFTITK